MSWFVLASFSALFSATAAILQKQVLSKLNALEFSIVLSIINAILVFAFISLINLNQTNSIGLCILYGKTILGALAFWCVMLAIKNMEISGALPLMVLTPGIVAILSFVLLGEILIGIEIVGIFLLLVGTYLLEINKASDVLNPFKILFRSGYHHYIIYALVLFSISSVIDKLVIREYKVSPLNFVFFQQIFLAINFLLIAVITKTNVKKAFFQLDKNTWIFIFLISIITLSYRYTQIEAIKLAPVALVLSVKRTSVFFASIIGGKIFSEKYLLKKGIAIIIMLLGAYLLV